MESYEMMWNIVGLQQATIRDTASNTTTSYAVSGLDMHDNTTVRITVTSVNVAGSNASAALIVHSDYVKSKSDKSDESENGITNIGVIIGGALGIFFIGIVTGTVTVIIVFKLTRKCRKTTNNK